ncbi:hypothetical protein CONCODRAFT_6725 [Conidiobolus coronatus NRRL 28638]|uniref:Uncharacterized protein n=1 Tax=Conidiobolus coronatus (strain ATCC 28846 / CBS 209.66 / NRRL 28638) TaxID=796925 RepID=A0A137P6L8_CONC2|nr:hypothetical protein CONCODRAFT_6725 [Conidiobolus coronatus NRRL 28638]|eukprot:KXN70648.1 hypothetical protein CONCODRAFT_6725 [Conidiobolus coronatus NRRL 28638]
METKYIIKSALLKLFDEGKSEVEAFEEFTKIHWDYKITKTAVKSWYKKFRAGDRNLEIKKAVSPNFKLTDESLVELIKENPDYTIEKLSELSGVSTTTVVNKINRLKCDNKSIKYRNKDSLKFTDEFLIDLVKNNPDLTMAELAKLADTSPATISNRIKQINSKGQRVNYVKKNYIPEEFPKSNIKLTDEYIINLINENSRLNLYELAELAGISQRTLTRRINRIKLSGKEVNYIKKDNKRFTDEFLTNLVNENPNSTMTELARIADTSISVISRRLKKVNSNGEKVKYASKRKEPIYNTKSSNEFLIDLVKENPDLNLTELSKLAGISPANMSKHIKKFNSSGIELAYIDKRTQKDKKETSRKPK